MTKFIRGFLPIFAGLCLAFSVGACEKKGPAERAGERIDEGTERAGERIEETTERAGEKLDDAGERERESTRRE
jgi:hypothetical protein